MRGRFIVIEGPDGCGKSLHSGLLAERLQARGHKVLLTDEPTTSEIGKDIRVILSGQKKYQPDTIQLLFSADRAEHVSTVITPALEDGVTVVCNRYRMSTILYGSAKGVDRDWLTQVNSHFPDPDCTILLLPPIDVCLHRIGMRSTQEIFEKEALFRRVYRNYAEYAETLPRETVVDTSRPVSDVSRQIEEIVLAGIPQDERLQPALAFPA